MSSHYTPPDWSAVGASWQHRQAPYYAGFQPAPAWPAPGIGLVVVISALFGVFGVIPAASRASAARQLGHPTGKYWAAWLVTWVVSFVLVFLLFSALALSVSPEFQQGVG